MTLFELRQKLIDDVLRPTKGWRGAEIGVQSGDFSRQLLSSLPHTRLFMVDAWRHFKDYQDIANVTDSHHSMNLLSAIENTKEYQDNRSIIIEKSPLAAGIFPNEHFDWIYLDAAHDEKSVLADLNAWMPKLKPGGVMCGDDYYDGVTEFAVFGVKTALEKFAYDKITEISAPGLLSQWWFKK